MTPLPTNPTVVVLVDNEGTPRATASNVAEDLKVVVTRDWVTFGKESCNRPFKNLDPDFTPVNS